MSVSRSVSVLGGAVSSGYEEVGLDWPGVFACGLHGEVVGWFWWVWDREVSV